MYKPGQYFLFDCLGSHKLIMIIDQFVLAKGHKWPWGCAGRCREEFQVGDALYELLFLEIFKHNDQRGGSWQFVRQEEFHSALANDGHVDGSIMFDGPWEQHPARWLGWVVTAGGSTPRKTVTEWVDREIVRAKRTPKIAERLRRIKKVMSQLTPVVAKGKDLAAQIVVQKATAVPEDFKADDGFIDLQEVPERKVK